MVSLAMPSSYVDTDDNKYGKKHTALEEAASKGCQAWGAMSLRALLTRKGAAALLGNPFQLYVAFLVVGFVVYNRIGGSFSDAKTVDQFAFISTIAESLGLISLRLKIQNQGSVAGISGSTLGMYALIYTIRQIVLLPPFTWNAIDSWATEALQVPSLLMVFGVLRSVLVTYRKSYQEDLDVLGMKHLVPACLVLAALIRPSCREGFGYSLFWGSYVYLDVLALLPQVVMMAQGGGKVLAPISHFVAATTLSRVVDLWFWFYEFDALIPQLNFYLPGNANYSACLIVFLHVVSLVLVADFMYYYLKARFSGSSFSDDCDIFLV